MERRQPIVLAGRVTSVVGELVPKTLRGTRGERIAVDVAQHVEHMTLVTIGYGYGVISGFPEMPGPTKQAIQGDGRVPIQPLHQARKVRRILGLDQVVDMIAHQGDAMEACRILEERTTERIENHRPRFTTPKIEGAVVAPNRDVIRAASPKTTARTRHGGIP